MKTTKRNATRPETHEWLMAPGRNGARRIETIGWWHLARLYGANRPNSPIRKAINAQARRCGYTPRIILALHGWTREEGNLLADR